MSQYQPGAVQCDFIRPQCMHADDTPLFLSEYKRTNRTRASKIVRCFPHCCPEHRPRSYCGTSLHVKLQLDPNDIQELQVLGRFEEHEPSPDVSLRIGAHARAEDILAVSSTDSVWVKGEIEAPPIAEDDGASSHEQVIYALRGSADGFIHWEYDWKSGTSQRQRSTHHHFRVYVFAAHSGNKWEVVGMATSPPFKFSVYRKPQQAGLQQQIRKRGSVNLSEQGLPSRTSSDRDDDVESGDDEGVVDAEPILQSPPARASGAVMRELLWHHQNGNIAKMTTNLAILSLFAYEGDPSWLIMHTRPIFRMLRAATASTISDHLILNYVNHCVPQLIALLPRSIETPLHAEIPASHSPLRRTLSGTSLSKLQGSMELVSELLCFVLDPAQASSTLAFVSAYASLPSISTERRRDVFARTLEMFADQVETFLQQRDQSIEGLVDDVVSIVLAKKKGAAYHRILFLLRNIKVMGQPRFDTLLRRLQASSQPNGPSPFQAEPPGASRWSGTWICRGFEHAALSEDTHRRRSWPDISRSPASPPVGMWNAGMMAAMGIILTALGVTITRSVVCPNGNQENECDCIGIFPITSPSVNSGGVFPLNNTFCEAAGALPLEWMALLISYRKLKDVYCRARVEGVEGDNQPIELEFLVCSRDPDQSDPWRCILRFELLPSQAGGGGFPMHPLVSPRRRMHVHVQVGEGRKDDIRTRGSRKSRNASPSEETKSDSSGSRLSGSSTESENCERRGHNGGATHTVSGAHEIYASVQSWVDRAKFKCIYYPVE